MATKNRTWLLLHVCIIFAVTANLLSLPRPPYLVCRYTGQIYAAEIQTASSPHSSASCCAVRDIEHSGVSAQYELIAPRCCDLRQAKSGELPTATLSAPAELAIAILADVPEILPPITHRLIQPVIERWEAVPRGPPPREILTRGPPSFS